jgi:hypothetical protein
VISTGNPFSFLVLFIAIVGVAILIFRVVKARPGGPEDSLRRTALGETTLFEGPVWVQAVKVPMGMGLTGGDLSRWTVVVRSGSIQLTSQFVGNFGPNSKNQLLLRSADVSMGMTRIGQRDCIALNGTSVNQLVEVYVSADGENQTLWSALSGAGVQTAPA